MFYFFLHIEDRNTIQAASGAHLIHNIIRLDRENSEPRRTNAVFFGADLTFNFKLI